MEDQTAQLWLWLAALGIVSLGPVVAFWVPRLGRSDTTTWNVEGHHFSERVGLFIIIALGESILLTGTGFAATQWTTPTTLAFASAFAGTLAMWWLYFDMGAERAATRLAREEDPGRIARLAYTYFHIPIVAGIIVTAASDEMVLAHPNGQTTPAAAAALIGGPAVYLAGNLLFKGASGNNRPLSHWVGLWLLGGLCFVWRDLEPLSLSLLATAVLIFVAVQEMISFRGARRALSDNGNAPF